MRSLCVFLALMPLLAKESEPVKRLEEAAAVFSEIMATPDKGIPQERIKRVAEAARAAAQTEAERVKREIDAQRAAAQAEIERAAREKAEAEAARAAAVSQHQAAQAEAEKGRLAAQQADRLRQKAEAEKAELRVQLLRQFNAILETRDTARGLIVNMADVLFDAGKYAPRPGAREKLARVGGIISGHPGLRLEVEGHTDSVGGDEYNQRLSEQRAASVRDYLVQQGLAMIVGARDGYSLRYVLD